MDIITILGVILTIAPLLVITYFVIIKNASAVLESVFFFKKIISYYFSQYSLYNYDFGLNRNTWGNVRCFITLLFSWILINFTFYINIIFMIGVVFEVTIKHSNALLLFIALSTIGIRVLIYREGRQTVEIIPWIVSISFFCWNVIGLLDTAYAFVEPVLINNNITFITKSFSSSHLRLGDIVAQLPRNPVIIIVSLGAFLIAEYLCHSSDRNTGRPTIMPSSCGPWMLCSEIHSNISRIIGNQGIIDKARTMIKNASQQTPPLTSVRPRLVWVTKTCNAEIVETLTIEANRLGQVEIVNLSNNPLNISHNNITCINSRAKFPNGFLIIPGKEVLIFTFSLKGTILQGADVGFYTDDAFVISMYFNLYQELLTYC